MLNIGMIGLDTSHCIAYAKLLHDSSDPYHVSGGRIVVACHPGGSEDFELSYTRAPGFIQSLQNDYGVTIVNSIEEVALHSDAILLTSADGRVHLEQFKVLAPHRKPVFIDKPLATRSSHARQIFDLAREHQTPIMSSSSLRYFEGLQHKLAELEWLEGTGGTTVYGADCFGPMSIEPTQQGLFWYGIHTVEMLYAVMGTGCKRVSAFTSGEHDVVVGEWQDGRIGTVRGNRLQNSQFSVALHTPGGTHYVNTAQTAKPFYASLLEQIMDLFQSGAAPLAEQETLEVIRFIEAANESRERGGDGKEPVSIAM